MSTSLQLCYEKYLPGERYVPPPSAALGEQNDVRTESAFWIAKLWPNGSALHVRFMGGTSDQHALVEKHAIEWSNHANIKFVFDNRSDAEIRISFEDDGAWSYIGKDALNVPLHAATMNFGWLDQGVILHEFGHALGMIHEHQNPNGGIEWNKQQVYEDLAGAPNFWSKETVDHNMFRKYLLNQVNAVEVDEESIMLYAIPKRWTKDGFHSTPNDELSAEDKKFIGASINYPFEADQTEPNQLEVAHSTAVHADIGKAGEEDLYTFAVDQEGEYIVETLSDIDLLMSLYGPNSRTTLLTTDDDGGIDSNPRIRQHLMPGMYFVQVRHFNEQNGTGRYSIEVRTA